MSNGPTTLRESGARERASRRRWFPRLRDARIRSKLALILVVPIAAVVALASVRLVTIGREASEASLVRALTGLSTDISALGQDIHKERMAAAAYLASPGEKPDAYNQLVRRTDERISAYKAEKGRIGEVPAAVESRLKTIDDHLATLDATRKDVMDRREMTVGEAVLRYGVIITDLISYGDVLGQLSTQGELADSLRAVAAFARAKAATADQEAIAFASLSTGSLDREQFASFVAAMTSQQESFLSFSLVASPQQRDLVDAAVTGDAVVLADRVASDVSRSVGTHAQVTAADAARSLGAVNDLMRWTEVQLENGLSAQAERVSSEVIRQALIEAVVVFAALVIAVFLAVVIARSLNRSLRRLREGALYVADEGLPEAVSRLRDVNTIGEGGVEEIVRQVRDPIRLPNRDEIGQVAAAFNVVHKEAVRVAAEQAALRTSVATMFLSLARRSQALVDRMIGELDSFERGEEDPKRLAKLFELDHLATRMRRNDENLLVLAGADSNPPRREDALLVDVLRAAQSEVENYNRIEFGTVDPDISVAASAVNDVVRLVAELLDNATRFSPPNSTVLADARRIRDFVIVQVEDNGIGLTETQLESLNRRLARPATMDVTAFRLMGLAVVGRLAARYGIQVELRPNNGRGTVAQVTLPSSIVVLPAPRPRDQALPRPRQPLAVERGPAAAPLQDTRYESAAPAQPTPIPARDQWRSGSSSSWGNEAAPSRSAPLTSSNAPASAAASTSLFSTPSPTPVPTPPLSPRGAGLPNGPVAGFGAIPAAITPHADDIAVSTSSGARSEEPGEAPIFREMEAVWFRTHGQDTTQVFTMPPLDHTARSEARKAPAASGASNLTTGPGLPTRTPGQNTPPLPYGRPAASSSSSAASTLSAPAMSSSSSTAATAPPPAFPPPPPAPPVSAAESQWRTAADEGWALASRAAAPSGAGTTRSGLPKRVPSAQLVPGGVETASSRKQTRRTPDEVRGLLSAYHRGVQRGRAAGGVEHDPKSSKEING